MPSSPLEKRARPALELELFDDVFPQLMEDLTKTGLKDSEISDAIRWFKQVSEYNVPFGKKNRGLTVVHSYKYLLGPAATEEGLKLARIIGWCIEWLQAFFLVADDIMDKSITRRGQPCWYKKDGVGLVAINDSFYLEAAIYELLRLHIRDKPYYVNILELFHRTTMQTIIGQNLDLLTGPEDHVDFSAFTMDRYSAIVKWKTAYYSFYLPVAAAMYMAGISDESEHSNAESILLKMGHFFQVQDDYLDCFGDPSVIGKVGTDIQDNKCGWLVVQALQRCNTEQRKVLQENYAKDDQEKVAKVKALYEELNLRDVYLDYENNSYEELLTMIEKLHGDLPKEMFIVYAKKIYKRDK